MSLPKSNVLQHEQCANLTVLYDNIIACLVAAIIFPLDKHTQSLGAGHTTETGLGKQWETMDLVTFGLDIPLGAGLGKQWEAMDLVTFGLDIPLGQRSGGNGKQWIW